MMKKECGVYTRNYKNNDDTLSNSFKGNVISVSQFIPKSYEEEKCKEIARELRETHMNPILSVLRKHGFRIIETAWGFYKEDKQRGKQIDNPPAYFQGILKKLSSEHE